MIDVEAGSLEKRVRRYRPTILALVTVSVQISLTVAVLVLFGKLSSVSQYGTSLLLSSLLCGLSQGVYQLVTRQFRLDHIAKFHVWGSILGIWTRFWTNELAYKFDRPIAKLLWDQLLGNPIGVLMFSSLNAHWEGYNVDLYLQRNLKQALKASLTVWPLASVIQFYVLDPQHVFVFNAAVNFVWNLILSLLA